MKKSELSHYLLKAYEAVAPLQLAANPSSTLRFTSLCPVCGDPSKSKLEYTLEHPAAPLRIRCNARCQREYTLEEIVEAAKARLSPAPKPVSAPVDSIPVVELPLDSIRVDSRAQSRAGIDESLVAEYAKLLSDGVVFPPIVVFFDGSTYWLSEGFHRYRAYQQAGMESCVCAVNQGGLRDAILQSLSSNSDHGKRRTNADKRYAVELMLKDADWCQWSDREIARQCAVSHEFVRQARPAICQRLTDTNEPDNPQEAVRTANRDGTTYKVNTAKIGKPQPTQPVISDNLVEQTQVVKYLFLDDWLQLSDDEKIAAITPVESKSLFNKQDSDSIDWAKWSWNPITGCRANCLYCYASDMANRLFPQKFEPSFHSNRLLAPSQVKVPDNAKDDISYKNVFTCSMADLFGRWVPSEWIETVLNQVRNNPQWNFLFLTKYPKRLVEFDFPENAWMGTTVDCQARVKSAEDAFEKISGGTKWLSIEPLLQPLQFTRLELFDWMAIGGSSQSNRTPEWIPPFDWIANLHMQARRANCRIYHKSNLGLTQDLRVKEFPWIETVNKTLPDSFNCLQKVVE